jgi:hypothetical protein
LYEDGLGEGREGHLERIGEGLRRICNWREACSCNTLLLRFQETLAERRPFLFRVGGLGWDMTKLVEGT